MHHVKRGAAADKGLEQAGGPCGRGRLQRSGGNQKTAARQPGGSGSLAARRPRPGPGTLRPWLPRFPTFVRHTHGHRLGTRQPTNSQITMALSRSVAIVAAVLAFAALVSETACQRRSAPPGPRQAPRRRLARFDPAPRPPRQASAAPAGKYVKANIVETWDGEQGGCHPRGRRPRRRAAGGTWRAFDFGFDLTGSRPPPLAGRALTPRCPALHPQPAPSRSPPSGTPRSSTPAVSARGARRGEARRGVLSLFRTRTPASNLTPPPPPRARTHALASPTLF